MAVEGIRGVVEAAIQRASQATGVDFAFLIKTARRESGFDPRARASSSSAAGLFQFVEQTWLSTLKQHGSKYGYARYADLISRGSDGRYRVQGDEARRAVMDLRLDPHASSLMAGELASDHAAYLKGRVGRPPTAGELYAAHFLGPQGSARLIEAVQNNPDAAAARYFPDAARANKSIFYRDGRAASVAEVYANLTRQGGGSGAGQIKPDAQPVSEDGGFIQYASARRADRQRQQDAVVALILRGSQPSDQAGVGSRLAGSIFTTEMLKVLSDARSDS
ncbi:transglycosylase SLT domain-containing protein [Phenylobacterium deserti]|uniref:Lytic transglycosylase domain-containing protein n=1 Tax=Phenylobacterium deserti TaxID=1914756 RepID=A0A328A894_9CAUL|nr:transglycosylase SLT domain-containing protein [Phenylobacterium deserti]RAK50731.1 lytic transglycosylase domain-containing protein [Phenylobacterium deserti]